MEDTTKRQEDANSEITDNLNRGKGKVSYGKVKNSVGETFLIPC